MKKIIILIVALVWMTSAKAQWFQNFFNTIPGGLRSVYFPTTDIGYAVGVKILKTIDAGENWMVVADINWPLSSVYFVNADTGYAVGSKIFDWGTKMRYIWKTTDGGNTWTNQLNEYGLLHSVFFTDANKGYAVGTDDDWNPIIYKTTNGGLDWNIQVITDHYGELLSVFFVNANTGYAVGSKDSGPSAGFILKTTDGGLNWFTIFNVQNIMLNSGYFPDANTGYAVGHDGIIFKTTNGGTNWIFLSSGTSETLSSAYFLNSDTGYVVGGVGQFDNYVILKTTDGGLTWNNQIIAGASNSINLNSVFFTAADTGYAVGYSLDINMTIIKTENGGGPPVVICENNKTGSDISIYPNPSNDKITIYLPEINDNTWLQIFNVSGVEAMERQLTNTETQIDIRSLPRGVYFVKVWDEEMTEVMKLVKQ